MSNNKKLDFLSKPLNIDFIAYHDLQAQSGYSVFDELNEHFNCQWLIGPDQKATGSEVAVFFDHIGFHPEFGKSSNGYKYLFHMSHDLADVEIYQNEAERLKYFDIIFTPSYLHTDSARKYLGDNIIIESGWSKFDHLSLPAGYESFREKMNNLPFEKTIMYTPGFSWTFEWKYLFPLLKELPYNFIVKNAPYLNKGQAYPKGQEEEYRLHIKSSDEMEEEIKSYNLNHMIVAPREINVCTLFPEADILISDQSSTLLEFLAFGVSIETGRCTPDEKYFNPVISKLCNEVIFMDKNRICDILSSAEKFENIINNARSRKFVKFPNENISSGQLTALMIDRYIYETGNKGINFYFYESLNPPFTTVKRLKNKLIRTLSPYFIKYKIKSLNIDKKMLNWSEKYT